jgi:tetratricopeptide (TPR) repeat protein
MIDLRQLLYEKERIGKVLELIRKDGIPDPQANLERALLYAQALLQYGDLGQAMRIFSDIPPHPAYDAERLWGLAAVSLRMRNLEEAMRLLDEARNEDPEPWLLARIFNTILSCCNLKGDLGAALQAYEQGIAAAEREPSLGMRWVLEGRLGIIQGYQGRYEESLQTIRLAVKQLQSRDCVLSVGTNLVSLGYTYQELTDLAECERCFARAEHFIEESGSLYRRMFLRIAQGGLWVGTGRVEKAERAYEEIGEFLREHPSPDMEIRYRFDLARLALRKGDPNLALRIVRDLQTRIKGKGITLFEDPALFLEGRILIRTGAVQDGLKVLELADRLADERRKPAYSSLIGLHLALGHLESKQPEQALRCMKKALAALERTRAFQDLLEDKEDLVLVLLYLVDELPLSEALSTLIVHLRHPALVKRLLKRSPEGKRVFLDAIKVYEARHFRRQLAVLSTDPVKEVRRATRLLLQGWQNHAGFRIYTFGTFRIFLEGKLLTDQDWGRPGVKRLFLFLLAHKGEWKSTETLQESLWRKTAAQKSLKILRPLFSNLRALFEPWHLPGMAYAFFHSRRGAYGFFPGERFWMDDQEFESRIKQAESVQRARKFKEARKAYCEALGLYLGDYLEEFPYEDWLNSRRDYLRELYFRSVLRYAKLEQDSGNLPEARRVLEEALFKDLSRCDCITLLIQVLSRMKLTQQARDWGDRHLKYIMKELREKPTPEVVEALGKLG